MSDLKLAEVVPLDCVTSLHIPCDRILEAAKGKLKEVIVIGYTEAGDEFYFAASEASGPEALWKLEQAKLKLLNISN